MIYVQKMLTETILLAVVDSEETAMDETYNDSILVDLTIIEGKTDNKQTNK